MIEVGGFGRGSGVFDIGDEFEGTESLSFGSIGSIDDGAQELVGQSGDGIGIDADGSPRSEFEVEDDFGGTESSVEGYVRVGDDGAQVSEGR